MKRLFLTLTIITLICLFCFANAKTFNDVKGTKYEASVDILTTLNIVDGYTDGTYRPNNAVTRAEMAKLIIIALGKESTANSLKGETKFSDVKGDSWCAGYINCAVSLEIIKGYPDGTFLPSKSVTYVEASTMLLRALNYTKELESATYPTGYMTIANNAGLLNNVTANSSQEAAVRGNIATMVVNTLESPVRKIVSTSSKGEVIYGDSIPLIESSFTDIKYIKDGEVIDVDFNDKEIVIRDKTNSRRVSATIQDEDDLKELYMRKVTCLYNNKEDTFLSFDITDKYKVKNVKIDEIDDDVIYVEDSKDEYELPDEDAIFLLYITNYDEADNATLILDEKDKVIGVVLEGTPTVYAGIVNELDITVNKRKGFELLNPEGKYDEYALSNTSEKLKEGAVVLFTLNNSKYAKFHEKLYVEDALTIEDLKTTSGSESIKLKKKSAVDLSKDDEKYIVYFVSKTIKEGKLKDIETEFDLAYVCKIGKTNFVIVFEDGVSDEDIVSTLSVSEAREKLEKKIKSCKNYVKNETKYSIATYIPFIELYEEAVDAVEESSSAAKLELLERKLSQAIDNLKTADSKDKKLRNAYEDLQDLISEASSYNSSDYTSDSFSKLTTAIKNAKAIDVTNTTVDKLNDAYDTIQKAINMLVTKEASNQIQSALKTLNADITEANSILNKKSDYTDASISTLTTALNNAKKLNQSTASLVEINNQISNLESAIESVVPKVLSTYKTARNTLDATYKKANTVDKTNYTSDSYSSFKAKFDSLATKYKALKSVAEVSELSTASIKNEVETVNSLNTNIQNALDLLVVDNTRANLNKYITKAKTYTQATWKDTRITYKDLMTKVSAAEALVKNSSSTKEQLQAAATELMDYITL